MLVDGFGAERLIWGSDVGQSMLWDYAEKVEMACGSTALLTGGEARAMLHDNAARIYGFDTAKVGADPVPDLREQRG